MVSIILVILGDVVTARIIPKLGSVRSNREDSKGKEDRATKLISLH